MKPLLLGDRATSAVPAQPSLRARFGAWARESLLARAIAVLLGLGVLAMIGGSALAGSSGVKAAAASSAAASSSIPSPAPAVAAMADAGAIAVTRPELLPEAPHESTAAAAPNAADEESAPRNATRATPDDPVDLNTARIDDLRRLPGIGAKRAEAILALRARLPGGRFRQIEDLMKVKGIGRAMLKRLHPLVRL